MCGSVEFQAKKTPLKYGVKLKKYFSSLVPVTKNTVKYTRPKK
jgi:hypothetical protein